VRAWCCAPLRITSHAAVFRRHRPNWLRTTIAYSYWSSGDEWRFDGPGGESRVRIRPWMHCNNGDTCREVALQGEGVILQPDFLIAEDLAQGRLIELCVGYRSLDLGIYALYPSRKHVPAKLRALLDFLAASLAGRD
jgi:DNA-binding transcriptional LysR family regulator